ncbi:uncharacterized protein Haspin isoform X13 [Drosophila suzukii]|uniref:Uncharacterized protein Haspin isoform X13 n=1 Tax=Drosophila suzukii TaxID=28584 RepID=A0ABM4TZ29_DROSZ
MERESGRQCERARCRHLDKKMELEFPKSDNRKTAFFLLSGRTLLSFHFTKRVRRRMPRITEEQLVIIFPKNKYPMVVLYYCKANG